MARYCTAMGKGENINNPGELKLSLVMESIYLSCQPIFNPGREDHEPSLEVDSFRSTTNVGFYQHRLKGQGILSNLE